MWCPLWRSLLGTSHFPAATSRWYAVRDISIAISFRNIENTRASVRAAKEQRRTHTNAVRESCSSICCAVFCSSGYALYIALYRSQWHAFVRLGNKSPHDRVAGAGAAAAQHGRRSPSAHRNMGVHIRRPCIRGVVPGCWGGGMSGLFSGVTVVCCFEGGWSCMG